MKFETSPEDKTITMRGGIGDFDGHISANDFIDALNQHTGDITIHLDSPGGSVTDGLHVDTLCASIATVVACAADRVVMNSNGKYMIHRAWTVAMGNAKDFRGMADIMEMMDKDIAETYVAKAGGEAEDWLALMDKETWFDAESALQAGLIDEIIEMKKKYKDEEPKASVISPNVQILARETARRIRLRTSI
jgi:ATP-dependent Clp protease protease subunit